jgi:hypothetical protein
MPHNPPRDRLFIYVRQDVAAELREFADTVDTPVSRLCATWVRERLLAEQAKRPTKAATATATAAKR